MENQKRLNIFLGGVVTLISFFVYLKTVAPTSSFWDCGEFIACSRILGVPHPPGAPLYLLIGRVFSLIPFAQDIAFRVNLISVIVSALTVLFTYLIIVRLIIIWRGVPKSISDILITYSSGVIGALCFAFTDSHWFNAVEAEVYAISMFFTAAVVWLILVWMEKADDPKSDRYILMIALCIGLAIAVHLLNILTLPFVFLVIYFRKFQPNSYREFLYHGMIAILILLFTLMISSLLNFTYIGLLIFIIGHILYLKSKNDDKSKRYSHIALTLGIGIAIFMTIYPGVIQGIPYIADNLSLGALGGIILVLIFLMVTALVKRKRWLSLSLISLFLILIGYSTYITIYIRSGLNPAIDENNPETTEHLVKYLNREQYGTWSTLPRRFPGIISDWEFKNQNPNQNYKFHELGKQLNFFWNYQFKKMYMRYFGWQFIGKGKTFDRSGFIIETFSLYGLYGLPFIIGLLGMIHHFSRDWKHALSILILFIMTGIAIVVYLNQPDPQPRERDYVYAASFFSFALWIGIGINAILEFINKFIQNHKKMQLPVLCITIVILSGLVPLYLYANFDSHDRTGNYVAYDFSYNLLNTCEPNSILFTNGDNDTFPLWFIQEVYNIRKDVRVINLSLLNTHWYIRQLRDMEPSVPMNLSDWAIDNINIRNWKKQKMEIPVPETIINKYKSYYDPLDETLKSKTITFEVKPTFTMGRIRALQIRDQMVLRILQVNSWKRPIYFGVTVPRSSMVGLDKYLKMEGLAYQVMPYRVKKKDYQKLRENLIDKYQYRGLNDTSVYLNYDILRLMQNYRSAFLELVEGYFNKNEQDKAAFILTKMSEIFPEEHIPYTDERLALMVSHLYRKAGLPDEHEWRAKNVIIQRSHLNRNDLLLLAGYYSQIFNNWNEAEKIFLSLILDNPNDSKAYSGLYYVYNSSQQYNKAVELLEDWCIRYPEDTNAKKRLNKMRKKMASDMSIK
jgi:hypothetical protein